MPVRRYQEFIPHVSLQDSVKRFWVLEKEYTADDEIEEVVPDPCVELIFNFGSSYSEIGSLPPRRLPNVCLVGVLSKPLKLRASGVVKIVAVRFFAWGALSLLKNTAAMNSAAEADLDPLWRQVADRVAANIQSGKYENAVAEIEDFLLGLRLNELFGREQVRAAAKLLYTSKGQFRVAELADYCNLSVRQLQRQFDETTGVSPKTLGRIIRFEAIRNRLMSDANAKLTDLAYEFGYTDQAHFIKDFKTFTGKTPSEYAIELEQFQKMFRDNENVVFLQSPATMTDYTEDAR